MCPADTSMIAQLLRDYTTGTLWGGNPVPVQGLCDAPATAATLAVPSNAHHPGRPFNP